jgi:hypothetical protein
MKKINTVHLSAYAANKSKKIEHKEKLFTLPQSTATTFQYNNKLSATLKFTSNNSSE